MNEANEPFWERPEIVERFADREADRRLIELLDAVAEPSALRVLDLGCAGGRNTELLARAGCDVYALDASDAMVRRTRERLAPLLGEAEAEHRVRPGRMDDLGAYPDDFFDLVVALGIFHNGSDMEMWDRALEETRRVLVDGGQVLVADFAPGTEIEERTPEQQPGEPHVIRVGDEGRHVLLDAEEHDASFAAHGFRPTVPTRTVVRDSEHGRHVTVNALYVKRSD